MADWPTVAVAFVSATAALSGAFIKEVFDRRSQSRRDVRDDLLIMRDKVDNLFRDIDHLEAESNKLSARYFLDLQSKTKSSEVVEPLTIGHIRSNVALYFPEFLNIIEQFDDRTTAAGIELRKNIKGKELDVQGATAFYTVQMTSNFGQLSRELRAALVPLAQKLGEPIRKSREG